MARKASIAFSSLVPKKAPSAFREALTLAFIEAAWAAAFWLAMYCSFSALAASASSFRAASFF